MAALIAMRLPLVLIQLSLLKSRELANVAKITRGVVMHGLDVAFQFHSSCALVTAKFARKAAQNLVHFEGVIVQRTLRVEGFVAKFATENVHAQVPLFAMQFSRFWVGVHGAANAADLERK